MFSFFLLAQASFSAAQNVTITATPDSGCVPLIVQFNDSVQSGTVINSWFWDFGYLGNTSTLEDPIYGYFTPGVFSVMLITQDTIGTIDTAYTTITVFDSPSVSLNGTDASCNGSCDGAIDAVITGGLPPYASIWGNGASSQDLSDLCFGNYSVTVYDGNSCSVIDSVTVNQPPALSASVTPTSPVLCFGDLGALTANVTGGVAPYFYLWSDGSTAPITVIAAGGTYSITISDFNGCTATAQSTITQNPQITLSVTTTPASASCDGTASVIASGGSGTYTYQWDFGGNICTASSCASLCSGTNYGLTVTDANNCSETEIVTIGSTERVWIQATPAFGCMPLSVQFSDSTDVGFDVVSWQWDFNDGSGSTLQAPTHMFTNPGVYTVGLVAIDSTGAIDTAFTAITVFDIPLIGLISTDASCSGTCDGTIDATVFGGTSPYTFMWSSGETTEDISNACVGTYSVTVTDALGCSFANSTTIQPDSLLVRVFTNDATTGNCDGTAAFQMLGGTFPYTFQLNSGATTVCNSIACGNLCPGNYSLTVTDSNGCSNTQPVIIGEDVAFTLGPEQDCINAIPVCDPIIIQTNAYQGVGATEDIDGSLSCLQNGENNSVWYIFEIAGSGILEFTISAISQPTDTIDYDFALFDITNASCADIINGGLEVRCNYAFTDSITGLRTGFTETSAGPGGDKFCAPLAVTPGQKFVLLIDNFSSLVNGFILDFTSGTATFNYPYSIDISKAGVLDCASDSLLSIEFSSPIPCTLLDTDGSDFQITGPSSITISGASSYHCSVANSTQEILLEYSGAFLPGQTYQITVDFTDSLAYCFSIPTDTFSFNADSTAEGFTVSITQLFPVFCAGDASGALTATVSGGVPPFNYQWSIGSSTQLIANLPTGNYSVTVIDDIGCSGFQQFTLQPGNSSCVWPGDANSDGIANNLDILSIGIAHGFTDFARPNATLAWDAQPCPDWSQNFANGVNYKHADCNGDSIVDNNDTLAVSLNYGLTHAKFPGQSCLNEPPLFVDLPDTLYPGDTVAAPILFGTASLPVTDLYGVAFSIGYDENIIDTNSVHVTYDNIWLNTQDSTILGFAKDFYFNGNADVAMSRTDHVNLAQRHGRIGILHFTIKDDVSGKNATTVTLEISITNTTAIDSAENLLFVCGDADSAIVVIEPNGLKQLNESFRAKIFPNPANEKLFVKTEKPMQHIALYSVHGKMLLKESPTQNFFEMNMQELPAGSYVLVLSNGKISEYHRVIKY